jgi:hypothetical protein
LGRNPLSPQRQVCIGRTPRGGSLGSLANTPKMIKHAGLKTAATDGVPLNYHQVFLLFRFN